MDRTKLYLGLDISFNNIGISLIEKSDETKDGDIRLKVIKYINNKAKTPKSKRKSIDQVHHSMKMFNELYEAMFEIMDPDSDHGDKVINYKPSNKKVTIAFEVQGGSQSASAASKLGIAKGVMSSVLYNITQELQSGYDIEVELIALTPGDVKKEFGKKDASKEEIINKVVEDFDIDTEISHKGIRTKYKFDNNEYGKGKFEHIADAVIIAKAAANGKGEKICLKTL